MRPFSSGSVWNLTQHFAHALIRGQEVAGLGYATPNTVRQPWRRCPPREPCPIDDLMIVEVDLEGDVFVRILAQVKNWARFSEDGERIAGSCTGRRFSPVRPGQARGI